MADENGFGGGHATYKIAKTYKIVGTYNGMTEDVDTDIEDMQTALGYLEEYEMAFGSEWTLTIEEE